MNKQLDDMTPEERRTYEAELGAAVLRCIEAAVENKLWGFSIEIPWHSLAEYSVYWINASKETRQKGFSAAHALSKLPDALPPKPKEAD